MPGVIGTTRLRLGNQRPTAYALLSAADIIAPLDYSLDDGGVGFQEPIS